MYVWPRKSLHLLEERQNHPIVCFICQCNFNLISKESVFLSFLHMKLFQLVLENAFYYGFAGTYFKVDLLKFPRQSSCCECTDDTVVLGLLILLRSPPGTLVPV